MPNGSTANMAKLWREFVGSTVKLRFLMWKDGGTTTKKPNVWNLLELQ